MKVSELLFKIKNLLEGNLDLRDVWVEGQLSQPKFYHNAIYFNIKDEQTDSVLGCYVGKDYFSKVINKIDWNDGIKLKIFGYISVWNKQGTFKFIVQDIEKDEGLGLKFIQLEELKKKLSAEGLFDPKHKKKLPLYPQKVGIITSLNGAAIHDIYKTMKKNGVFVEIIVFPSLVQGDAAPEQLIHALWQADSYELDLIIITRGGGSFEDLYCFNNEQLVRTIFELKTPIISAVGHETDTTLCDFVADLRASTPTQSVNYLPNFYQESDNLKNLNEFLIHNFFDKLQKNLVELSNLNEIITLKLQTQIKENLNLLEKISSDLKSDIQNKIQLNKNLLTTLPSEIFNIFQIFIHKSQNELNFYQKELQEFIFYLIFEAKNKIHQSQNELNIYQWINDLKNQEYYLNQTQEYLQNYLENSLINEKSFIESQLNNIIYFMQIIFKNELENLRQWTFDLNTTITNLIKLEKSKLENIILELENNNHTKILEKGYSITLKNGKAVTSIHEVQVGDEILTILKDGNLESLVKKS